MLTDVPVPGNADKLRQSLIPSGSRALILGRKAQLRGSLRLTHWLRCRNGIGVKGVIGHNESLSSPFYEELDPDFRGRTHGDFKRRSMRIYRRELRELGPC